MFFVADLDCGRMLEGERLEELAKAVENAKAQITETSTPRRIALSDDLSPLTADLCGILTPRLRGMISILVITIKTITNCVSRSSYHLIQNYSHPHYYHKYSLLRPPSPQITTNPYYRPLRLWQDLLGPSDRTYT